MHASRNTMAKGFTLVEILIVVVILGILAAIVVPQFTNAANDARVGNVATQVSTIESQLELYAAQNGGSYPTIADEDDWQALVDAGYFKEIPVNPFDGTFATAAWDSTDEGETSVLYDDDLSGWQYDSSNGNIAAAAPASAAP